MNRAGLAASCLVLASTALAGCQQQPASDGSAQPSAAAPDAKPGIIVRDGVLVLPAVKGRPGAAYFTVTNDGAKATALAAVFVEGAGKAEMHETRGGSMAPIKALALQPGETVKFERGGKHVMLFDVAEPVKPGGSAEITLTFEGGDKTSSQLKVEAPGGAMDRMSHGAGH